MPTYDYRCKNCGHEFEEFQSITASPLNVCPACGQESLKRLIGTGAAVIFKGSGFYETDYRSESYKKAARSEKEAASGKDEKQADSSSSDGQKSEGGGEGDGGQTAGDKATGGDKSGGETKTSETKPASSEAASSGRSHAKSEGEGA